MRTSHLAREEHVSDNVAIVQRMTDLWTAGDIEGAMACIHPEVVLRQPTSLPWGGDHVGHEGMARMFEIMGAELDQDMGPMSLLGCGDVVVTRQDVTWTNRKTGATAFVPRVEVMAFRAGAVSEFDVYLKDVHALLGILSADSHG